MRPTVSQYAEALESLSRDGMGVENITENFLGFLKRRGESAKGAAIVKELEKRAAEQSQTLSVTVVTARQLDEDARMLLVKQAEQIFPGKKVDLQYEVDALVIGGARFRAEETLYDVTVLAQLKALKEVIHK